MVLAFGMLAAVLNAKSTRRGQVVDAAMTDGVALLSSMIHGFQAAGAWTANRESNLLDGGAYFYGAYRCSDGRYVAVGCLEPPFHAMFLEYLGFDPSDFNQLSQDEWAEARARIAEAFEQHPQEHWTKLFEDTDGCVTPVLALSEAANHPHNQARETFITVDGITQPAPAPRFSETPAAKPTPPRIPGRDMIDILKNWSIGPGRSEKLRQTGVLGDWAGDGLASPSANPQIDAD